MPQCKIRWIDWSVEGGRETGDENEAIGEVFIEGPHRKVFCYPICQAHREMMMRDRLGEYGWSFRIYKEEGVEE